MEATPCGVLYKIASDLAGLRKYDGIDYCLLAKDNPDSKGRTPYARVLRTPTFRTREIIQKNPHSLDASLFESPYRATCDLLAYIKQRGLGEEHIVKYLVSTGVLQMCKSLSTFGFDAYIFENALNDILATRNLPFRRYVFPIMLLFVLTGFYGDPRCAYALFVEKLEYHDLGIDFCTGLLDEEPEEQVHSNFALIRKYGDAIGTNHYFLSKDSDGLIIGRASTFANAINEVGTTVSRKHARIFWDKDSFYIEDLDSLYGTKVRHKDLEIEVVALPQDQRDYLKEDKPTKLYAGDEILLGTDTVFLMVSICSSKFAILPSEEQLNA